MIQPGLMPSKRYYMTSFFRSKGFTLIELLVVIAIIGLLAAAVSSNFAGAREQARNVIRLQDMKNIEQALLSFYITNQRFPNEVDDGVSNSGETLGVGNPIDVALNPFLPNIPLDPKHDAGTGLRPLAGALFFYSYDPYHYVSLENCGGNTPTGTPSSAVFGFNLAEGGMGRNIDTCQGSNVNLDNADYNRAL